MKQIFENVYLIFDLDKENDIFVYTWKLANENLEIEDFLVESKKILEGILTSKCKNIIGNDTDFKVIIAPEIQEKMNKTLLFYLNGAILKFAHIIPKELVSELSVEQLFEENSESTYEDKYFETLEQARKWIME